jgi:hypothetical protein
LWSSRFLDRFSPIDTVTVPDDGATVPLAQGVEARYFRLFVTEMETALRPWASTSEFFSAGFVLLLLEGFIKYNKYI